MSCTRDSRILRTIKRICMGKMVSTYKSSYHFRYLNCCQVLYSYATHLKLGISTYFSPALFIPGIHKVLGFRSRDQVLQRAYSLTQICCCCCCFKVHSAFSSVGCFEPVISPIILSVPKCSSRHFTFHRKYVYFE